MGRMLFFILLLASPLVWWCSRLRRSFKCHLVASFRRLGCRCRHHVRRERPGAKLPEGASPSAGV
eukprot:6840910-Prorocentrum_lima.AAC.1